MMTEFADCCELCPMSDDAREKRNEAKHIVSLNSSSGRVLIQIVACCEHAGLMKQVITQSMASEYDDYDVDTLFMIAIGEALLAKRYTDDLVKEPCTNDREHEEYRKWFELVGLGGVKGYLRRRTGIV